MVARGGIAAERLLLPSTSTSLPGGRQEALTIGLLSGNRNVTLVWAVAGSSLPWDAQAYLAVCVVPILALLLVIKLGLALPLRRRANVPAVYDGRR
jgi:hypothetical protein